MGATSPLSAAAMAHSLPFIEWDAGKRLYRVNERAAAYLSQFEGKIGACWRRVWGGGGEVWAAWVGRTCEDAHQSRTAASGSMRVPVRA